MNNKYLAFVEAHPAFVSLILIPIALAVFNGFTRPRTPEEYAALPPWFARFCKFMRAFGPVPQKILEAMKPSLPAAAKRASLAPPPMPSPFSAVEKALEGLGQVSIEVADSTPSTQPEGSTIPVPPKDPQ